MRGIRAIARHGIAAATLGLWLAAGAVHSSSSAAAAPQSAFRPYGRPSGRNPPRGNPEGLRQSTIQQHWSFRKLVRPPVPTFRDAAGRAWVRNPIDAFILTTLRKHGLSPSPPADRLTLLRRVTLDLTGLPPTPEEIAAFTADRAPGAYERVVRRLLASPHYGERWAQHWLDVVRFAETNGFELDADRPQAWRYRDYVVRALNADRPYDRFLTEQIAGDELSPNDFELHVATGFLRAGPQHVVGGNQDEPVNRQEWLTEAVGSVGNGVLGLTIGCARCHDHKFDPIPQADYYRLQAFFAATQNEEFSPPDPERRKAYDTALAAHKAKLQPLKEMIAGIERPYRARLRKQKVAALDPKYAEALALEESRRTREQRKLADQADNMLNVSWDELVAALTPEDREHRAALRRRMHALELEEPEAPPLALCVAERSGPSPSVHLLVRGDPHVPGAEVQPAFPSILGTAAPALPAGAPAGRRTALARWLTRPDNPLTSRVIVNRVWQHHFGRGLVATPNDFGLHGQSPSHPELLDWLACAFAAPGSPGTGMEVWKDGSMKVARTSTLPHPHTSKLGLGWSLKKLQWLMVTSSTYRQASEVKSQTLPKGLRYSFGANSKLQTAPSSGRLVSGRLVRTPNAQHRTPRASPQSAIRNASSASTINHQPSTITGAPHPQSAPSGARGSSTIRDPQSVDPDDRFLWRMRRERLDGEALRDSVLAAAGTLNPQMGGAPVRVPLEPEVYDTIFSESEPDNLWPVSPDPRQHTRRSLYLLRKRNVRLPLLAVFDQPDMMTSCAARDESVHALQALTLVNGRFIRDQSRALVRRLFANAPGGDEARIHRLYLLALGRPPRAAEVAAATRFLHEQTALVQARVARGEAAAQIPGLPPAVTTAEAAAWADLCLATLNLNEFLYVK